MKKIEWLTLFLIAVALPQFPQSAPANGFENSSSQKIDKGGNQLKAFAGDFASGKTDLLLFELEMMVIGPTKTETKTDAFIMTPNMSIGGQSKGNQMDDQGITTDLSIGGIDFPITLFPKIVENQGVETLVIVNSAAANIHFQKKMMIHNLESLVIELAEDAKKQTRFALKLRPQFQVSKPIAPFTDFNHTVHFDSLLLIRDRQVLVKKDLAIAGQPDTLFFVIRFLNRKGLFFFSLVPFPGALPVGVCRKNEISFKYGQDVYTLILSNDLLPEGLWRVWVKAYPESVGFNCTMCRFSNVIDEGVSFHVFFGREVWKTLFPNG